MKLLFVADGRSPTAINWIRNFIRTGHEVHFISTFPSEPLPGSASFQIVPVAFSSLAATSGSAPRGGMLLRRLTTPTLRTMIRQWLGQPTLRRASRQVRSWIRDVRPDLVHALRIPFEGMIAAMAYPILSEAEDIPLVVSVWGNDFTLHAPANPWMARRTRLVIDRVRGLLADSRKDLALARKWGLPGDVPTQTLPGGGGVDISAFHPPAARSGPPSVVNPRGYRSYVHTDAFFCAVPIVLSQLPDTRFICTGMAGHPQTAVHLELLAAAGADAAVEMLPQVPHKEMAGIFRRAAVTVSPTSHDGTPNTLLEAMACGSFPVAGDIDSVREWIRDGENGFLVNPRDPEALASAIVRALQSPELISRAEQTNRDLVAARAAQPIVAQQALDFYREVCGLE